MDLHALLPNDRSTSRFSRGGCINAMAMGKAPEKCSTPRGLDHCLMKDAVTLRPISAQLAGS